MLFTWKRPFECWIGGRYAAPADTDWESVYDSAEYHRWCSPADVMDRGGEMCVLIGPCRFSQPTGDGGIVGSNSHVPISSDLFQKPARHRRSSRQVPPAKHCDPSRRSAERAVKAAKRRYRRRCRVADGGTRTVSNGNRSAEGITRSHPEKARRIAANERGVKPCYPSEESRKWQRSLHTILISTSTLPSIGRVHDHDDCPDEIILSHIVRWTSK